MGPAVGLTSNSGEGGGVNESTTRTEPKTGLISLFSFDIPSLVRPMEKVHADYNNKLASDQGKDAAYYRRT